MPPLYFDTAPFTGFSYGPDHPMRLERLALTTRLLRAYQALDEAQVRQPVPAAQEDLLRFHTREYLQVLADADNVSPAKLWRFGLGPGDNPVFEGLYRLARLSTGATLAAAQAVAYGECTIAFNVGGGMHHAMPARASGFCYLNDPAIAILWLRAQGMRVAYVDIDAHHGDGVQAAFYDTDQVLTVSFHQDGTTLFPYTGFIEETGRGPGKGFAVNVPLPPYSGDESFRLAFDALVPPLLSAFQPDIVVTQLGVDTLASDPLTLLRLSTNAVEHAAQTFKRLCPRWVALGGGGYDLNNVPRAWALVWGCINEVPLSDELPREYVRYARRFGAAATRLRDDPAPAEEPRHLNQARRIIELVRERSLLAEQPIRAGSV